RRVDGAASEVGFNGRERGLGGRYGGLCRVHLGLGDLHVGLGNFHRAATAGEFLGADAAALGYRLGEAQVALRGTQPCASATGGSWRTGRGCVRTMETVASSSTTRAARGRTMCFMGFSCVVRCG